MTELCRHWRTPVEVAGGTVLCSGWLARPGDAIDVRRAFYLDPMWGQLQVQPQHEVTLINWPDFGVIEPRELDLLAKSVLHALPGGPVDLGCLGGHGRTGILLATVVGRAESLAPDEAIAVARTRYCAHAVETAAQEELVAAALASSPNRRQD